jgi:crossover junction endodeoxyribonuclease RuvC
MTAALPVSYINLTSAPADTRATVRVIVGIDPGAHGAIAVLTVAGELLAVYDMPSIEESAGRPSTNAPLLAKILKKIPARIVFCEWVSARPTDSKTGAFSFGRARGVIEGACGAFNLPIKFLTPPTWKGFAVFPQDLKIKIWLERRQ